MFTARQYTDAEHQAFMRHLQRQVMRAYRIGAWRRWRIRRAVRKGTMTINEARRKLGLAPVTLR